MPAGWIGAIVNQTKATEGGNDEAGKVLAKLKKEVMPMVAIYATRQFVIEGVGTVTVETLDFTEPGYVLCGYESMVVMPDGTVLCGTGPEADWETPDVLHQYWTLERVAEAVARR